MPSNAQFRFRDREKLGVLGGFASAIVLSVVAFLMAGVGPSAFLSRWHIHFNEAIGIACLAPDSEPGLRASF